MNTDNLEGGTHLSKGYLFRFLFFNLIFRLKPKVPKLRFNAFWWIKLHFSFKFAGMWQPYGVPRSHINIPLTHDNGAISLHEVSAWHVEYLGPLSS